VMSALKATPARGAARAIQARRESAARWGPRESPVLKVRAANGVSRDFPA
jgi:hypothetical protein